MSFCTENASGSTSQAANIAEALEAGSRLLLVDEDTSATNFMIRDEMMQQLIAREKEPVTPFIDQVRNLYREHGVSTVLVMGGSGEYFEVADTVIAMDNYEPRVVTGQAREIAAARKSIGRRDGGGRFGPLRPRVPLARGLNPRRGRKDKVAAKGLRTILCGREMADLTCVEQLIDRSQTRAIGDMVWYGLRQGYFDGESTLTRVLDRLLADVRAGGLDVISPHRQGGEDFECTDLTGDDAAGGRHPGDYALPRRFELAAMLNRLLSFIVRS